MKQELINLRTRNSKTIDNGDGTRTLQLRKHGLHYFKDGRYEDIDTTIVNGEMHKAGYSFGHFDNKIIFAKNDDWIEFEVDKLQWSANGETSLVSKLDTTVIPVIAGNEVRWDNAFGQGIHLLYGCSPDGIYKQVIIDDYIEPPAYLIDEPELLLEVVLKYKHSNIKVKVDGKEESFDTYKYVRKEKVVFGDNKWEFRAPVYWDSGVSGSDVGHRIITRNTIQTGVPYNWLIKAMYPAIIDTDVNEQVGASTDDITETDDSGAYLTDTTNYIGTSGPYANNYDFGTRFTSVAVPKDATINSAVFSLFKTDSSGTLDATLWGIDEDDTLTWAADDRPSQRTKTTSNVSADKGDWGNFGADVDDVWITRDISSIISEITSRASWASDNSLAVVVINNEVATANHITHRTWDYEGNLHGAKLDINYTAAAAGWGAKINGITPGKVNGILVANIGKICGV